MAEPAPAARTAVARTISKVRCVEIICPGNDESAKRATVTLVDEDLGRVIFRPAKREDLQVIVRMLADDVLGQTRESGEVEPAYVDALEAVESDARNQQVVAELDGQIVGTLQLTFIPGLSFRGGERAQIEGVRIASEYRGRGIGRAMIEWAISAARSRGCRMVQLTTNKQRSDAVRFYSDLGFEATHEGMKLLLKE